MNKIATTKNEKKIAVISDLTDEQVAIIKNTVAKGTTDIELAYFLQVSKSYELNPFKKEVWCYKDAQKNLIVFAGRDGHLAAAQKDPRWSGIASSEVRENDNFMMNIPGGVVSHTYGMKDRGNIMGAYAICKPRGCDIATIEWVDFNVYNKGYATWKSDPAAMIKKVAETHTLKKAYGLSGLASEYDFEIDQTTQTVYPLDHETTPTVSQIESVQSLINNSTFDDDQRSIFEDKLLDATHSELDTMRRELEMNQQNPITEAGNFSKTDIRDAEIPEGYEAQKGDEIPF